MNLEQAVPALPVMVSARHLENVTIPNHGKKKPSSPVMGFSVVRTVAAYGTVMSMGL